MTSWRLTVGVLIAVVIGSACADSHAHEDAASRDGGRRDGGWLDGGWRDGSWTGDAASVGNRDAGSRDAGEIADGGEGWDGGMDGGIATDGETVREDGGTPRDGGIFDASPGRDGEVDAAVADAGGVLRTAIYDVIASDDDALQDPGGPMLLTHWWISLYSDEHWGALRFELSGWNPAATIHDAYLEVYVDSTDEDSPRLRVFAERSPDAARLASTNNDIGSRPRTRSAVPWNDDDMGASWQRSPSIAILLREVTSLPGWRSGSHFLVIFDTQPDPSGRTFEIRQWDHSGGSYAARLVIEYSE